MIDIQRLRELLATATPGPWWLSASRVAVISADSVLVCSVNRITPQTDLELIAAAVNALPQLLAIAEAATAWGQTMCTKPRECTHGDHASDCDLGAAEIRLLAAVDAARKERT